MLVAAVAAGSSDALRLLHRRHAPWLRARLRRTCRDADAVDEALQDTFVAVWKGASRFHRRGREAEDAGVAAWIWTIARRRLVSTLRRKGSRWIAGSREPVEADTVTGSAEEAVLSAVEHGEAGSAMARLSPELRAVVQSCVLDGLTVREASHRLEIPEGTVKTRMRRAKARLREELA